MMRLFFISLGLLVRLWIFFTQQNGLGGRCRLLVGLPWLL